MKVHVHPAARWIKLGPEADSMHRTLSNWFDKHIPLFWVPINDIDDNTTDSDVQSAGADFDEGWLIHRLQDLATLPEGMKGWLVPLDTDESDVACGRWNMEITFMQITDRQTGAIMRFKDHLLQAKAARRQARSQQPGTKT